MLVGPISAGALGETHRRAGAAHNKNTQPFSLTRKAVPEVEGLDVSLQESRQLWSFLNGSITNADTSPPLEGQRSGSAGKGQAPFA